MRILGLYLLLIAALFAALTQPPMDAGGASEPVPAPTAAWTPPSMAEPDVGNLPLISQRPLFEPRRRPTETAPREDPVPAVPRIRLSAVSISSNIRVAVIKDLDSGGTRRVREGEKLNDWTVKRVHGDEIVLQWKDRETIIPLSSRE